MGRILGIDLGTTNSAVAVWDRGAPRLIASSTGTHLTPSVVGFADDGEVTVGEEARHDAVANARRTIYSAKRFIGRPFEAVTADRDDVPYEIVAGDRGQAQFLVDDKRWSPEEISAMVLRELKRLAEAALGDTIDGVVITAPAHFNDAQRAATRNAGRLAGLDVRRILNEPTAAALAYGLDRMVDGERIVAVYDFGGGTFDVSVLSVGEDIIEVLATRGDPRLGGDMIDSRIAAWLLEQFATKTGVRADENAETLQFVREAAEKVKIGLSDKDTVEIRLAFPDGAPQLETSLSRETFDGMVGDLVDRTLACCSQVLVDAGKQPGWIDEIVLAGGSTRIPIVRRRVAEYFGREPLCVIDPDEVVAMGAAVQAGILAGELKGVVLVDVTSLSLGIETHEGRASVVIPRNTTLPVSATRTFTTSQDGQTAVQFHVVQGESKYAERNVSLGRFVLDGLVATKAGILQIEVTFTIDINGMVLVSARDVQTAREQTVTISVNTAAAREGSATKPPKQAAAAAQAPVHDDPAMPAAVRATLDETEQLLGTAGEKLTRVDRASVMKQVEHLRNLFHRKATADEMEHSREALAKVVARVKKAKPPKKRA